MEKDTRFYEYEILKSINKIEKYIGAMALEDFSNDEKTFDACCMMLQNIGECGIKLSHITFGKYKKLPLEKISGFRNRISHDYMGIDDEIVWGIIKYSLPELKKLLEL